MTNLYGDEFQELSKYHRHNMPQHYIDWDTQPTRYKTYAQAPKHHLPKPHFSQTPSLFQILQQRQSIRQYNKQPLTQQQLSQLLWATTGIRKTNQGFSYRTAPSAGALFPIETYLIVNNITDLPQGIYHYGIQHHQLETLQKGDFRQQIAHAALDQPMCTTASVVFVWTAVFERMKWKYGQRAYRYIYLDCGHIAENLALTATSIDLGSCQIAALYDDEVNALLGIDGKNESVLYLSAVGLIG